MTILSLLLPNYGNSRTRYRARAASVCWPHPPEPFAREEADATPLEARPEADFSTQGGILAPTPRTTAVGATAARITVPQVRQVEGPAPGKAHVAR